ncbi:MAG: ABC transporter substrate-binding protein [Castellaniella sp.]|uniref:ABC transporter substrate-binding protein n=1 Tax=Castellaniella sp. TaxID=1955812 RepID=UPI002A35FDD9|nr:ABC transporter substrate-binding protein [Castellaniella sp.]MDY0309006.1 ABC transporter substrate-binding protein [Castellaniella sp.]
MTLKRIDSCCGAQSGRRQFLKLSSLFTMAGALPLLQAGRAARAAEPDAPVRIGYLPITDATPLLVAHHNGLFEQRGLQVEKPRRFRSWSQIVEAFLSGQVNVVHLLMPMTIWSRYGSKSPAKVVAWNHMEGSCLTVQPDIARLADLGGTTVAIPFWYSVHNIVLQALLREAGLECISDGEPTKQQVKLVVMSPGDMLPALGTKRISGYIVAEPFNAKAEELGVGKVWRFTGDVWRNHACCVVTMHERDLQERPEWSQKVVDAIVQAQAWTRGHREETVQILERGNPADYTPHDHATLARVLLPSPERDAEYARSGAIRHPDWQEQRIDFQPYPFPSYTEKLVELLKTTYVLGENAFLKDLDPAEVARDLVDERYVRKAIEAQGGPAAFGIAGYTRTETFSVA